MSLYIDRHAINLYMYSHMYAYMHVCMHVGVYVGKHPGVLYMYVGRNG